MNRDLSVSAFNPEFAFENRNLRLSTNENNTMLSWVNEKGTEEITIGYEYYYQGWYSDRSYIEGIVIGTAVLNEWLVLFSHSASSGDSIYKLKMTGSHFMEGTRLFNGNLGFDLQHPIETLVSYESENIQKVYWTDKKNQPRVINIAANKSTLERWNNESFDFIRTLQLNEKVYVKKLLGASGVFPAGVIQYAFTYFDKYGQESNIFYTTPLLYTSHRERGGSPEDKVDNAFEITVNSLDTNFDFMRIYSIMRTSIDGTPICKRIQDISIKDIPADSNNKKNTLFVDTGNIGDSIDPVELLYKGGESIVCGTIEQKDGTLFLGDISIIREQITGNLRDSIIQNLQNLRSDTRTIYPELISEGAYRYSNQLTSTYKDIGASIPEHTVPCGGFKRGELYRLGLQFQYKTGKWSDPIKIQDELMQTCKPDVLSTDIINLPVFKATLSSTPINLLLAAGYKKVRPVCVFPGAQDRRVVCQGVINPTMFTEDHRYTVVPKPEDDSTGQGTHRGRRIRRRTKGNAGVDVTQTYVAGDLWAQSSWFFRGNKWDLDYDADYSEEDAANMFVRGNRTASPKAEGVLPYYRNALEGDEVFSPWLLPAVEIQGIFNDENKFQVDCNFLTFHSPDIEFDSQMHVTSFNDVRLQQAGNASLDRTLSDIDIQLETPPISNIGSGFVHKAFNESWDYGIISGLFYDDCMVDDSSDELVAYDKQKEPAKWMVYLWNKSGSLNNDMNRPAGKGVRSAILKKKIISNSRISIKTTWYDGLDTASALKDFSETPQLFSGEDNTIVKINDKIYKGNIDTLLIPDEGSGYYFSLFTGSNPNNYIPLSPASFNSVPKFRLYSKSQTTQDNQGFYVYKKESGSPYKWVYTNLFGKDTSNDHIGNTYLDLVINKAGVRMKYKSTPHLVFEVGNGTFAWEAGDTVRASLPVVELIRENVSNRFGGNTPDAYKANNWIPCGEPVELVTDNSCDIEWSYGDTYYQRWDCLKTYAFTEEDENQVVEIGSFMLETRTNIDGRYDRNRGQSNNLYMSPRNFNLINPVYSQQNNFFTYKILDSSFYENNNFPNQVTWSLTKQSSADVDMWTQVTLASILDLDGDKGKLNKIIRFNDQLIAFQDTGISQIMFNENTALTTTEGVPIEIANSGKVQGKRYISNSIGCSNKWSIAESPLGIYFMDSNDRSIYMFNGQLNNLSTQNGFNTWCKKNIVSNSMWTPASFGNFVGCYDKQNQDVLFVNRETALAFSEKLGAFTSFYDYGEASWLCNLGNASIWVKDGENNNSKLWRHQGGEYCNFFGEQKDYGMILIGNPEPLTDKIFTNLEFRACVDGEGEFSSETAEGVTTHTFGDPYLPFDYLETWNEYQHGLTSLEWRNGIDTMRHHTSDNISHLARKFRIWRCDIPRDNIKSVDVFDYTFDNTFHQPKEIRKMDRMRNPWLYLKLKRNAKDKDNNIQTDKRVEIHDMVMTYYN